MSTTKMLPVSEKNRQCLNVTLSSTLTGVCWGGGWLDDTGPLLRGLGVSFDSGKPFSTISHREQIFEPLSNTLINLKIRNGEIYASIYMKYMFKVTFCSLFNHKICSSH